MRILIIASLSSSLQNFRGQLILDFLDAGAEVHVAAPGLSHDIATKMWLSGHSVACHDINLASVGFNPLSDILSVLGLIKLMNRVKPSFFFGYTIKPVIYGLLAARILRIPRRIALITGLGYTFIGNEGLLRNVLRLLIALLYKLSLPFATLVLFQNPDDLKDFRRQKFIPSNLPVLHVAGSGVDLHSFPAQPLPRGPIKFLLVARLLADKGIREYVGAAHEILKRYPDVEFHLVGSFDSNPAAIPRHEVQSWQDNGILKWHGYLKDVRDILAKTHVFVLPSYREGLPRSTLEALATGRPIITTDVPGCRETVLDGVNGFLVPHRDITALASAMSLIIEQPLEHTQSMALASYALAREKFDVHKVNSEIISAMGL